MADIFPTNGRGPILTHKATSLATTNLTAAVVGPARVVGGYLRNRAAAEKFLKLYNKASAPVLATDVPLMTIGLPAGAYIGMGDIIGTFGMLFPLGVAYAITGAYANTDATAVAAGDVDVNLLYV
jgi:hypothetical protein